MFFFKILYFVPILCAIVYFLLRLVMPRQFMLWAKSDAQETKRYELRKEVDPGAKTEYSKEHEGRRSFFTLMYLWFFVGLLSSSWFVFASLIVLSIVLALVLRSFRNSMFRIQLSALLHISLLGFALINSFHLHIKAGTFWQWVTSLL